MAEIIIGQDSRQDSDEGNLEDFLRTLASGGTDQRRLAAEGAMAAGYLLSAQESLPEDIQQLAGDTKDAILKMMADPDPEIRQAGMGFAWNLYIGERVAHHHKPLELDDLFD